MDDFARKRSCEGEKVVGSATSEERKTKLLARWWAEVVVLSCIGWSALRNRNVAKSFWKCRYN